MGEPEVVFVVLCCPGEAWKCSSTPKTNLLEGRKPSLLRGVCCVPTCIKVQDLLHITAWMGAWEGDPKCCNFSLSKLIFHLFPLSPFLFYLCLSSELLASTARAGTKLKHCLRFFDLNLRVNPCTSHAARDCCLSALPLVGDICFPEASLGPAVGILGVRRTGLKGDFYTFLIMEISSWLNENGRCLPQVFLMHSSCFLKGLTVYC